MSNSMKRTARQTSARTLADLLRAMDRKNAMTITYRDRDGEETVRTIEIHDIRTTRTGQIVVRAMCRMRGEIRTFYPERIVTYTIHRMRFVLPAPTGESRFTHAAATEAEFISLEMDRDYPDVMPLLLAA